MNRSTDAGSVFSEWLRASSGDLSSTVREALRDVKDPELGINIVKLGMVRNIEQDGDTLRISIVPTTPSCPMRDYLEQEIKEKIRMYVPPVPEVQVECVQDPPWSPDQMEADARQALGL